ENKRIPKRSALDPCIEKALQSSARKLPDRKLASEANTVAAPASLSSEGGKARRPLGAGRSAEQQSHSRNAVLAENKRIPKRSALDPCIEKALQSSARKLPDRKLCLHSKAVTPLGNPP